MRKLQSIIILLLVVALPFAGLAEIEPAASEQLHAMQKLVRQLDNITINGVYDVEYELGGTKVPYNSSELSVIFQDPLIIHNTGTSATGEATHLYIVQQGDELVVYASHISEEYKTDAEQIEAEDLEVETMGELDAITHAMDDMVSAKTVGEETITVNGVEKACIRIAITVDVDDMLEEIIHNTLLSTPNSDHSWTDAVEKSLHHLLVPMEYWLSKEDGMVVQYTIDLSEVMSGVHAAIPDEADGGFTFTRYLATCQVFGVNDAEDIVIPAKYIAFNEH